MGYEYFYQNIAEWLLLSMLIFIDSPLQNLMEKVSNNTHLIHVVLSGPSQQLVVHSKNLTNYHQLNWIPLISRNRPNCFVRKWPLYDRMHIFETGSYMNCSSINLTTCCWFIIHHQISKHPFYIPHENHLVDFKNLTYKCCSITSLHNRAFVSINLTK
jgi:hypothetical protein